MRRSSRFWMGLGAASLFALAPALAQDAADPNAPSTQGNVSVTVYNGGTSLVQDIRKLIVNPEAGVPVTLETVAEVIQTTGPGEIHHSNQGRVAVVSAGLATGVYPDTSAIARLWQAERTFYPTLSRERAAELMGQWEHAVRQSCAR